MSKKQSSSNSESPVEEDVKESGDVNLSSPVAQLINPKNLALLKQGDRFIIMGAGLIVIASLGALTVLRDAPQLVFILASLAMLIVAGLVGLVQWRGISMRTVEADLLTQAAAAASVNGEWWQLVYSKDHPGLSYVSIYISEVAERHAMHGITYDGKGRRCARWSSDAVAIKTTTPVELYYVWKGSVLEASNAVIISGIGRFRFDSVGREKRPLEAEGAFTRGSPTELNFGKPRAVELIRFSEQESRKLANDPSILSQLAIDAFERFRLEKGRDFSQKYLSTGKE